MNSSDKLINVSSRQLQVFLAICQQGSFAAAADSVHLSPSGISMLVKELEKHLGVRLFERTTRTVSLTDAGLTLRPYAEKILGDIRQLDVALKGTSAVVKSRLTIAATPVIATCLLPQVVAAFARQRPDLRIQVIDGNLKEVRQSVMDGHANMGIAFFIKPTAGMVRTPICKFSLVCISPASLQASHAITSRTWRSLDKLPMIALPAQNPIQQLIDSHLPNAKTSQMERAEMNFLGTVLGMVQAGLGHAVVPSFMIEECRRMGLSVARLTEPVVHLNMYAALKRDSGNDEAQAQFLHALAEGVEARASVF